MKAVTCLSPSQPRKLHVTTTEKCRTDRNTDLFKRQGIWNRLPGLFQIDHVQMRASTNVIGKSICHKNDQRGLRWLLNCKMEWYLYSALSSSRSFQSMPFSLLFSILLYILFIDPVDEACHIWNVPSKNICSCSICSWGGSLTYKENRFHLIQLSVDGSVQQTHAASGTLHSPSLHFVKGETYAHSDWAAPNQVKSRTRNSLNK